MIDAHIVDWLSRNHHPNNGVPLKTTDKNGADRINKDLYTLIEALIEDPECEEQLKNHNSAMDIVHMRHEDYE